MADKPPQLEDAKGEEATIGIKADVKTLQLLSSSAKAALDKRERNKNVKALRSLHEAVQRQIEEQNQQGSSKENSK
ncbi:hypothetical protein GX50_03945 [[Emmonsia] crescens]|uniref:Uncharacterized protein n=1 Tax=[Emmonsia] crescens TaxID=73230 RepID=A0A2B7ZKB8_9EURO|nr:hypothetical protein GX50_03945 [Emmonsia crescens]